MKTIIESIQYDHGIHIYIGQDFPTYQGEKIEVRDFNKNENFPAYSIRFLGEKDWYDDFDDDDIQWVG